MIPTTVMADKAVGSLFTVGVLIGLVPAGRRLVPPHAAKNKARSTREQVHKRRFIAVVLSAMCECRTTHKQLHPNERPSASHFPRKTCLPGTLQVQSYDRLSARYQHVPLRFRQRPPGLLV